ncbi:HAMP domain-containing histidine kinase [Agreia pratensis]|uniref:sensor histidine kinase n=1 Tax=Agreia pratensis TaxID=150121 RepID=UPI00188CF0FE|nr:HAMP domain-containing sensor histidine kinase [Agreia pratensis]MBF4635722.1 HAMP domain-containing histidine kinase [Agreia pratensis]
MRASSVDDLRGASLRLTAQFTLLVLVLLAVVGAIVFVIVNRSVDESNQRALVAAAQIDSPRDAPGGTFVTMIDGRNGGHVQTPQNLPEGLLDADALRSVAAGGPEVRSERSVAGQSYLMLTTSSTGDRNGDRIVQIALNQHESQEELGRLVSALLVGGLVAGILAFAAAYAMARRAIRPLADALALQRRFVADASHELRTPLTLLSTRAQLLRREAANMSPSVAASVDDLVDDTKILTEILDDLLIAADPRSVVAPTPVDLVDVADEAVALLDADGVGRSVALERIGNVEPVIVSGSRAALLRLVIALATNACDHARSTVSVKVAIERGRAVVRVIDDGPGFAPDVAATAFERFASGRGGSAAQPASGIRHYGLGLAIVAEITRRHAGTVSIDTSYKGGAVACVFPLAVSPTE